MPDRPNVVLITCHDLGQHLGCYGVETVETPNLDGLADSGRRFENAHATAPVCSPARGSLLTGRYPQSNGLMGLTHAPWWWELDAGETALPELLAGDGYETHLIGFQHVADPDRLGFGQTHIEDCDAGAYAGAAAEVFDADTPFYAQIGFTEVHRGFDRGTTDGDVFVPPYLEPTETVREDVARFQASIEYLDERVGEVLDALDRAGVRDDTVVAFAADHGIPHPGAKWTCRRPGIETALIVDGPSPAFDGAPVDGVASGVDVLPTLLDAVECPVPETVEGVSWFDHLADGAAPPRAAAFAQYTDDMKRDNESRCVITDDRHLIRYFDQGRTVEYPVAADPGAFAAHEERLPATGARPFAQLYDVETDPYELDDIGSDSSHGETVERLSARLLRWMVEVDDPLLEGRVRLPYYERAIDDLLTRSARDG